MGVQLSGDVQNTLMTLLIKRKLITSTQADLALQIQKRKGKSLEAVLLQMGWVTEADINKVIGELWDIPVTDQTSMDKIEVELIKMVPEGLCRKHTLIPICHEGDATLVAMTDPFDLLAIDDLQRLTGCRVKPILGTATEILGAIDLLYKGKPKDEKKEAVLQSKEAVKESVVEKQKTEFQENLLEEIGDIQVQLEASSEEDEESMDANQLRVNAGDPPVVKLVNFLLVRAMQDKASDIHVEPKEDGIEVRYRIDGSLFELLAVPKRLKSSVLSRLKILSGMDIAVKRVPQDGAFSIKLNNLEMDFRVNSLPTIHGEKIVLRLLNKNSVTNNWIKDMGLGERAEKIFRKYIVRPHGMILVTGPTGSGKSTTLYTVLNEIKSPRKNIITVEDPAEYRLSGIQQVQIKADIGFDFADALRAILRQDPDIIMIGEIRDAITAQIAVKSSLTGHLVLSTLHTNDAPGAIVRLMDIGIEPFLVASSVTMAVAQRLVRRICPKCKEEYHATADELAILGANSDLILYRGKGCENCRNTGYSGRLAIFEIFEMTSEIKQVLLDKSSLELIRIKAIESGMETLKECGIKKALEGLTTLEEILSTCVGD